ncbi:MAG: hypothetical protein IJ709_01450, partial [Selenomonas sp.]|nr:hypothetical protein [Selenomonas sp.]
ERIKNIQDLVNSRISLKQSRDNNRIDRDSANVNTFIDPNNGLYYGLIASNNALIEQYKKTWDEAVKYIGENQLKINNSEYQEYYNRAIEAENENLSLLENQEQIKKNIRDLRWKSFDDLQKTIENIISDIDYLSETIRDAELFDWQYGVDITEKGYANIQLLANGIKEAKQQIKDYRKALAKLDEELKNGNITETQHNELSQEYVQIIQDSAGAVSKYEDALVSMYRTQIQNETDLLNKNIQARKDALSAKKSYYDYDRTIKSKTKDITQIQAQIAALNGSTNQAAQAQLARLQAQLKDA